MRHRSFILVAVLLLLLVGGAVAAYAYDSSRKDRIAEGVTVAGTDVGGMTTVQAQRVLVRDLKEPLEQPVAVVYKGKRFTLSAEDAGVAADIGGMVDEAIAKSREGNIISRVTRDLTGGEEPVQVSARVTYSQPAVEKLVGRVKRKLDQPARDAEVELPVARGGQGADRHPRQGEGAEAADRPGPDRARRRPPREGHGRRDPAEGHPGRAGRQVSGRPRGRPQRLPAPALQGPAARRRSTPWRSGALGFDTPAGLYHIQNKAVDPPGAFPTATGRATSPARWCRAACPRTRSRRAGSGSTTAPASTAPTRPTRSARAASHGCIRMAIPDVIELYDQVPVGAPIYIA